MLEKNDLVLDEPAPAVHLHELGESSVNFRRASVGENRRLLGNVYWAITRAVKIRFDEEGISIPFPQRDIHVKTQIPAET